MYDPRLGRFLSTDPLSLKFPEQSPYLFALNSPIYNIDFKGMEGVPNPMAQFMRAIRWEFMGFGRKLDNAVSTQRSSEHTTSKIKVSPQIEVRKSVETTSTTNYSFGFYDYLEHVSRTNSNKGAPALQLSTKETTETKLKTTTTANLPGVTVTGVNTVKEDGSNTNSVTLSGPVDLGKIPSPNASFGIAVDDKGNVSFSAGLSSSVTVDKTKYSGKVELTESGSSRTRQVSVGATFSVSKEKGNDKETSSLRLQF